MTAIVSTAVEQLNTQSAIETINHLAAPIQAIYLFGSFARGDAGSDSDVDIAILRQKPLSDSERWMLMQELGVVLKQDVDVIDLRSASSVLRHQVLKEGLRLFAADDSTAEFFETHAFSEYVRLNEERAEILKDIAQRGSVFSG